MSTGKGSVGLFCKVLETTPKYHQHSNGENQTMIKIIEIVNDTRTAPSPTRKVKAFILKETEDFYVYIPLRHIMKQDYIRFLDMMKNHDGDLLEAMRDTKLENGLYAILVYDALIQTQAKAEVERLLTLTEEQAQATVNEAAEKPEPESKPAQPARNKDGTPRKKPGPKPRKKA